MISDLPSYNIFVQKKFLFWKFLMTSLHVIHGLGLPPIKNSGYAYKLEIAWKTFLKTFFFCRTLAAVSLVLGLEHSCPWPQEGLSSERLSLASDFFVSEALGLASSLVSSTPPLLLGAVFPISAKKCEKCNIFSGIWSLKFCKFQRFFSRQKPAFLFPAKNHRQLRFTVPCSGMSHESQKKLAELRRRTFLFFEINIKSEKKMPPSAWWPFFFGRSHWNRTKKMRKFLVFSHWV